MVILKAKEIYTKRYEISDDSLMVLFGTTDLEAIRALEETFYNKHPNALRTLHGEASVVVKIEVENEAENEQKTADEGRENEN